MTILNSKQGLEPLVKNSCKSLESGSSQEIIDGSFRFFQTGVVDRAVHELAHFFRGDHSGQSKDAEVLGRNGLLDFEVAVDLVDVYRTVPVNEFKDFKPQGVG